MVSSANFEAANIVLYTKNKDFFLTGEQKTRSIVNRIKKRIELRADEDILLDQKKTENFIKGLITEEAEITSLIFDIQRSIVIIEAKKPGLAIGKKGELLKDQGSGSLSLL